MTASVTLGALHVRINARDRRGIGGALKLALPQRPFDRVAGEPGRAEHQRQGRGGNDQGVAAPVPPELLEKADHLPIPGKFVHIALALSPITVCEPLKQMVNRF